MLPGPRHRGLITMRTLLLLLLLLKNSACLLPLIGDKAPPAARDNSEVARV